MPALWRRAGVDLMEIELVGGPSDGEKRVMPDDHDVLVLYTSNWVVWECEDGSDPLMSLQLGTYEPADEADKILGRWTWRPSNRRETG